MTDRADCIRCDHSSDDHHHADVGCANPRCDEDTADLTLAPHENCPFRCVVRGCTCPAMIRDPRTPADAGSAR